MISVIIPVYNPGKRFECCITSILNQTYRNLEIILVDDGSSDGSEILCDKYQERDARVTTVHLKNGGVSRARNFGLEMATGEYVAFIDSDDWIDSDTFEKAVFCMQTNACDIAMFAMKIEREYSDHTDIKNMSLGKNYVDTPKRISQNFSELYYSDYLSSSCTKLFKRSIIEEHKIRFDETLVMYEDLSFVLAYLTRAKSAYVMEDAFYHYMMDTSVVAVTKRKTNDLLANIDKVVCNILAFIDAVGGRRDEELAGIIIQFYMMYLHKIFVDFCGFRQSIREIRRMLKQKELKLALRSPHNLAGEGIFYKLLDFSLRHHLALLIFVIYKKRY